MTQAKCEMFLHFDTFMGVFSHNKAKVKCKVQQSACTLLSAWLSQKHKVRKCVSYGDGNVCKVSIPESAPTTPDAARTSDPRRPSRHNAGVSNEHEHHPACDSRDAIASALQLDTPVDDDTPCVITAWIIIAEYAAADGSRYIVTRNGASEGSDHATTPWQRRGMLHEVLDTGLVDDPIDITFELEDDDE
jgi:hypothetical protein